MERKRLGGWVYAMANRYRRTMYVGVTANLPSRSFSTATIGERISAHVMGCIGSFGPNGPTLVE